MNSLSHACDSKIFFYGLKESFANKIQEVAKNYKNLVKFSALPIGLCWTLLELAESVSILGEFLLKGLANILGRPFSDKCSVLKGLKQIFVRVPSMIVGTIVKLVIDLGGNLVVLPVRMLTSDSKELKRLFKLKSKEANFHVNMYTEFSKDKTPETNNPKIQKYYDQTKPFYT